MRPLTMILVGFGLSLLGVGLPLLMLIRVLPSTIFINFLSFTASMAGLMLGIGGAAQYVRARRK
jgi:hypothetical protein